MLLQPAVSYRFRIVTEFTDVPHDSFTCNVNSCEINLIDKVFRIEVRQDMTGDVSRFIKNMVETDPNFIVEVLSGDFNSVTHSLAFTDTKIKKCSTRFDYACSEVATWSIEVGFEKFSVSKSVKPDEKESE